MTEVKDELKEESACGPVFKDEIITSGNPFGDFDYDEFVDVPGDEMVQIANQQFAWFSGRIDEDEQPNEVYPAELKYDVFVDSEMMSLQLYSSLFPANERERELLLTNIMERPSVFVQLHVCLDAAHSNIMWIDFRRLFLNRDFKQKIKSLSIVQQHESGDMVMSFTDLCMMLEGMPLLQRLTLKLSDVYGDRTRANQLPRIAKLASLTIRYSESVITVLRAVNTLNRLTLRNALDADVFTRNRSLMYFKVCFTRPGIIPDAFYENRFQYVTFLVIRTGFHFDFEQIRFIKCFPHLRKLVLSIEGNLMDDLINLQSCQRLGHVQLTIEWRYLSVIKIGPQLCALTMFMDHLDTPNSIDLPIKLQRMAEINSQVRYLNITGNLSNELLAIILVHFKQLQQMTISYRVPRATDAFYQEAVNLLKEARRTLKFISIRYIPKVFGDQLVNLYYPEHRLYPKRLLKVSNGQPDDWYVEDVDQYSFWFNNGEFLEM